MSPTIFREKGYRFFFFSREESRMRVHVISVAGEAKFWLAPSVALARNHGLSGLQLKEVEAVIEEHRDEFIRAWRRYFGS